MTFTEHQSEYPAADILINPLVVVEIYVGRRNRSVLFLSVI